MLDLQSTKGLSQRVDRELLPWELSENTTREGDRRVEMSTTLAASVHAQHDTDTPAPTDGLVVTLLATGQDDLSHDTVTKHQDDERPNELGEGILQCQSDPGP